MTRADEDELLDYWESLGYGAAPPSDFRVVQLALSKLLDVVNRYAQTTREDASGFFERIGEPAIAEAVHVLLTWWGEDVPTEGNHDDARLWAATEQAVAGLELAGLSQRELARLCCWVAAVRTIDDANGWLRGRPEWAGITTYPGSIQVLGSTWSYADGEDASDAWIPDLAAQLRRHVGRKARSKRWLQARLSSDDGDRRGQLPGLLVCSWLLAGRDKT